MVKMNSWMITLLVFLLNLLQESSCAPTLVFAGITADQSGVLRHNEDFWSTTGTLTIPNTDTSDFFPEVKIEVNNAVICSINLTDCTQPLPTSTPYCQCISSGSNSGSNVYGLSVKQLANQLLSLGNVSAIYQGRSLLSPEIEEKIGQLPQISAGSSDSSDSSGLSGGAIAGIIIGVLAAVGAVAGGVWWFTSKKRGGSYAS